MTKHAQTLTIALASAMSLPSGEGVPDWVHLLPAGELRTHDGRGPYTAGDATALIAASMANERGMPIDENHATDLAAPSGGASPACGWIVELQARADGIWGRVEWNRRGRVLLSQRAYRGISPVMLHDKTGTVRAIARASLTNVPNLRGLTPVLNQETTMDFMATLAKALGLGADATEDSILAAISKMSDKPDNAAPALMSEITALGTAFGVTGDATAILTGVKAKAGAQPTELVALQAELATMATTLPFADGGDPHEQTGMVYGSGGPRDDKVPAWISPGEFIVNAKATRRHRHMLEGLNTAPRFADGGMAGGGGSSAAPGTSAGDFHAHFDLRGSQGEEQIRKAAFDGMQAALAEYRRTGLPGDIRRANENPRVLRF